MLFQIPAVIFQTIFIQFSLGIPVYRCYPYLLSVIDVCFRFRFQLRASSRNKVSFVIYIVSVGMFPALTITINLSYSYQGMCLDLCIQFTLMFWTPTPDEEYVLYVLSAMWGLTDSIWQTQINSEFHELDICHGCM